MKILIFDTETTGLPKPSAAPVADQPKIIEIACVKIDLKEDKWSYFDKLINPAMALPSIITKITGITDDDLDCMPYFHKILPGLKFFFQGVDVLIAHNLQFDKTMLELELKRAGCEDFPWPAKNVCTVNWLSTLYGPSQSLKLEKIYGVVMGHPMTKSHRAKDDCLAVATILAKRKYEFFDKEGASFSLQLGKILEEGE